MSVRLTAAQKRVVLAEGNVLVDAGAGSGKTTTVVQLLLHALGVEIATDGEMLPGAAHPLTLEQVAAITFTNAAAADLIRKMREALRRAGRADLATDVDAARLGTIHGFCGELLRSYALRAELPPGQRVLTDAEARAEAQEAARDAVHQALADADVPGLEALVGGRKLRNVIEWVADAASDSDRLERWSQSPLQDLRPHELALMQLARKAAARRQERLEALGALDFDTMLVAARDVLRIDAVRQAVQRRLRLLVVDEFQDVDPVQQEIAMLLGGLERGDPNPTRLVLVGDPKQSIYRFRRADVTLWGRTKARFEAGAGQVLPLQENFRSKAAILGFVDHVVGTLLDTPIDAARGRQPYEVDFSPLKPRAAHAAGDEAVELFLLPPDDKGKPLSAGRVREREFPAIAQRLLELNRAGYAWEKMAVLLPAWSAAEEIQAQLTLAGIPSYVPRGKGFWEAREVLDCTLLLRAVRDLADDTAVVGLLKSPFVGLRDETLLVVAQAREAGESFYAALRRVAAAAAAPERALMARALTLLESGAALRDRMAAVAYLDEVLRSSGYLAMLALDADQGAQRIANVRKLLRLLDAERDQSLGEFLREVREARAREDDVAPERLYGERGEVVTISTVHSAKGLEWDVVVLADLSRQLEDPKGAYIAGREGFVLRAETEGEDDDGAAGGDERHAAFTRAEAAEQLAERMRLWYVAATRARQRLLLFTIALGEQKGAARSAAQHFQRVLGVLAAGEPYSYVSGYDDAYRALVRVAEGSVEPVGLSRGGVPDLVLPPSVLPAPAGAYRLSATQLMTFAHNAADWRRIYVERVPPDAVAAGDAGAGAARRELQRAIVTGQVVHAVLERVGMDGAEVEALVEEAIAEWDAGAPDAGTAAGAALRAYLRERVDAVRAHPVWREVAAAPGARRELGFTRLFGDGTVLVGALDLAAVLGDVVRVVDVKAGAAAVPDAVLAERYAVQGAVYRDAVAAMMGTESVRVELVRGGAGPAIPLERTVDISTLLTALRGSA